MDDLTPMEPSFQEQPPKPVLPPDSYGTGKHPTRPKTPLALIALLLTLLLTANLIAFAALLRLWSKDTVQAEQPSNGLNLLSPSPTEAGVVDPDRPDVMPIDGEQTALTLPELYRKVRDGITVVTAQTGSGLNTGTGVILDADGYLLTNAHTVNGALRLEVTLSDGADYTAAFVGMDSDSDLAVLKISAENLTAAEFGSADGLSAGDGVVILSNPFGKELAGTMSEATVAAVNEDVSVSGLPMRVLQISASGLNDGSGVVVNYSGQIIGIGIRELGGFTSFDNDAGVGFALPAQEARGLVNDLVAFGSARHRSRGNRKTAANLLAASGGRSHQPHFPYRHRLLRRSAARRRTAGDRRQQRGKPLGLCGRARAIQGGRHRSRDDLPRWEILLRRYFT